MKIVQLDDVCKIIAGQSPPSEFYNDRGIGLPFFQGKTDFGELHPRVRMWCSEPKKVAEAGDILISVRAPVGPTNLANQKCCIGRGLSAIRPSRSIDTKFLLHYFRAIEPKLSNMGNGSTFSAITQKDLRTIEIPLPPLAEQQRIAAILDKADALRAKRRAALTKLDTLLQSTFLHLFGNPVANPKGIPTTPLINVCKRITDGTHQPPKWADIGVPFLFVSNVVDGELTFDTKKFISMETFKELNERCPIERDDILYTIVGSYGNAAMVKTDRPFSFQRHIAHIKPNPSKIDPYFLLGMLQSPGVKRQADLEARGIAQKTLNLRELKKIQIFLPIKEQQIAYSKIRSRLIQQKNLYKQEISQLDNLFHALQQRAFKG